MMRTTFLVLSSALLLMLSRAGWIGVNTTEPSISYRAASDYSEHEPIVLQVVIDNPSESGLDVQLGRNRVGSFHFRLRRPDGSAIAADPGTPTGAGGLSSRGQLIVAPGGSQTERLLLNGWLEFLDIGEYSLDIRFDGAVRQANNDIRVQRTAILAFRILPRDATRLQSRCDLLFNQVRSGRAFADRRTAAEELSYVVDPIAVPYLAQAIKADQMIDDVAILGLERIGNAEARSILEQALVNRHPETAQAARDALNRLDAKQP